MSPFFGQEGYSAGPYGRPYKPGIFDRIMQGVGAVTTIADTIQKFQDRASEKDIKQIRGVASKLDLARAVHPDQAIPLDTGLAEKIGKLSGAPLTPNAEGKYELPAPGVKTLEEAYMKALQGKGQIPLEQIQPLYEKIKGKQQRPVWAPGVGLMDWQGNIKQPAPPEETTIYNQATGQTMKVPGKGSNIKITHPWVNPLDVEEKRESNRRGRETTLIGVDPRGMPVPYGTTKGPTKIINQKGSGAEQGVTFITPEEAQSNPGKTWPKGTRIIRNDDPAWRGAVNQANHMISGDPNFWAMSPEDKAKSQAEIAKNIYKESQAAAPSKPQGKTPAPAATKPSYTAAQVEEEYQKGLKEGRDPAAMKAKHDQLLQGLGGQ